MLGDFEAIVFGENFGEVVPAGCGLEVEDVEVEGDDFGFKHFQEAVDGFGEFFVVESFGKVAKDLAVAVVFDFHAITEGAEKVLMSFHEPNLKDVLAD